MLLGFGYNDTTKILGQGLNQQPSTGSNLICNILPEIATGRKRHWQLTNDRSLVKSFSDFMQSESGDLCKAPMPQHFKKRARSAISWQQGRMHVNDAAFEGTDEACRNPVHEH